MQWRRKHKWSCNPIPHCVMSAMHCHMQQSQTPADTELNSCVVCLALLKGCLGEGVYAAISPRTQLLSTDHVRAKLGLISRCGQNTRLQSTHTVLPGSTFSVQGPHYHPKPRHQQGLVHSRPQLPKHTISFKTDWTLAGNLTSEWRHSCNEGN